MTLSKGILLLFSLATAPLDAALTFAGYITSPAGAQFVLVEDESRLKSEFLKVGEAFQGHRIVAFDSEEEILVVQRTQDGLNLRLALKRASVRDSNWSQNGNKLVIVISADGTLSHNGRRVDVDSLEKKFKGAAIEGWLYLHVKPTKGGDDSAMRRTMLLVMRTFRSSGVLGRIQWDKVK